MWTMEFDKKQRHLAAGCEDGTVRLFNVDQGNLQYAGCFSPQESRILSLSWHPTGDHIVTGGANSQIQKWSVSEGRIVLRISLDQFKEKSTLVWAIACLSDETIISGDSTGKVQVWNGRFGTLRQSFQLHTADVLALVVGSAEDIVYASGVDNKVVQLQLVKRLRKEDYVWVNANSVRCHTHDVRAIVLFETTLISGGVDTNLMLHDLERGFSRDTSMLVPPFPRCSRVSLATDAHLVLFQYSQHLHIWSLGQEIENEHTDTTESTCDPDDFEVLAAAPKEIGIPHSMNTSSGKLKVETEPALLLEICSSSHHHILSSSISACGKFVAFSDTRKSRILHLSNMSKKSSRKKKHLPKATPISSDLHHHLPPAHRLAFIPDSNQLVLVDTSALVHVVKITDEHVSIQFTFSEHAKPLDGIVVPVDVLQVSRCGRYAATGDLSKRIHVFDLQLLSCISTLPVGQSTHTAIAFQPQSTTLAICSSNKHIQMFDFIKGRFTEWSREAASNGLPRQWVHHAAKVHGICFDAEKPSKMVLWGHSTFCTIDVNEIISKTKSRRFIAENEGKSAAKRKKFNEVSATEAFLKMSRLFHNAMFFSYFGVGNAVVVERPWHSILQKLPPALFRVRYGT